VRARAALAGAVAALVMVASPFVGEMRAFIERSFPGQYLSIVTAGVLAPVVLVVGAALVRIRDRRALRYGMLASACALGVVYTLLMQTSATEQFHFTEYGLVAFLFYRVAHRRVDLSAVVLPLCAAAVTGFVDEFVQWFVPSRVGEARDLALNLIGGLCGLMVGMAFDPPAGLAMPRDAAGRRMLAAGLTAVLLIGAAFLDVVHVGHEVRDEEAGTFASRYSPATLKTLSQDRASRWPREVPATALIAREDHYLTEATFHVQWRNDAVSRGDHWSAWKENLILERYYGPTLDLLPEWRWPAEQRVAIAADAQPVTRPYISAAYPFPIYNWNPALFWTATLALVAVVWVLCR
jgi:uncharacterized membrane protein YozB (DUF420 family)